MHDQAQALRHMVLNRDGPAARHTRIVTVTSGKGGVGKSNFSLNFALALQKRGYSVLLFDADIGMANIDVLLGIPTQYNLLHLLRREKTIWEIIQTGPHGLQFIGGGSGFKDLVRLSDDELEYFADQISRLHGEVDFLLFDTGAGLSKETVRFITAAQETIVVTTPEPTSITDAYALIKMVNTMGHQVDFRLIVNRVSDDREGQQTADNIRHVADKYLGIELPVLGFVPDDNHVTKAVKRQTALSVAFPDSAAVRGIDRIAAKFLSEETKEKEGDVRSFLQRMRRLWR
ncbi:MinD/ParA family protein [Cohnella lubricantis]|uniref:MinD/ParA family protein n=1 Tax=Cohnella lubricantis TaxID=2163172 RepID=A0A841TGA4_9BACL|nr:MinD/ParA family protein [Cohnella lubricantis]MBB6679396.1 MinD/ParA family protein [Cohnella lubricantis]MBP2117478.1 flagellar biosynthesis protein FlhG [Cohnella lubricantis]